jgi:hypothetical protein
MLQSAYARGQDAALARFGVKIARSAVGMPKGPAMHPAMAQMHADLHAAGPRTRPTPAPTAPAADTGPIPIGALPRPQPSVSFADAHKGVMQQQASNISARPAELPAARAFEGRGSAAAGGGTGGGSRGGGGGGGGGVPGGAGGGVGRFLRPTGKALGYGALAGAGMLAYGLHRQNQEDRDARNLTYARMEGTY